MKCEQMHELFSPYLDEMTSLKENELLEAHLQSCPMCAKHLDDMRVMCTMLKNLDAPFLPASFAVDLKKQLAQEKIKIFASREVLAPKKPSWLVAGVAGIALSLGILASSFMPMGAMMASLQNWINKDNDKPLVAVVDTDSILKQWVNKQVGNKTTDNFTVVPGINGSTDFNPTAVPSDVAKTESHTIAALNTEPVVVKERIVENYAAKINVEDIDNSLQDLEQVALASGARLSAQSGSRSMTATAAGTSQVVALKVAKENVDKLLNDLAVMGAGVPARDTTNYTPAYAEAEQALSGLEQDIAQLKSQADLTDEQQLQLRQLQNKQNDLLAEKQRIDKEINLVTVEVRLVEPFDP